MQRDGEEARSAAPRARCERKRTVCAATLTYKVAPFPADEDVATQLHVALLAESDRQTAANASTSPAGRWLSRAWDGVKNFAQQSLTAMRQSAFLQHFLRQLEANAEELDVVVVSARASLMSMGVAVPGLLFATHWGIYFVSDEAVAADSEVTPPASPAATEEALGVASEGAIKERIDFAVVASMLPSLVRQEGAAAVPPGEPWCVHFEGIPHAQVPPTALQIFTVEPRKIYQFLCVFDVVVKPPAPTSRAAASLAANAEDEKDAPNNASSTAVGSPTRWSSPDAPSTGSSMPACQDVVRDTEYPLYKSMPAHLDTFKLMVLLWKLWRLKQESFGLPSHHPSAIYADPH